jgi:O-antigen/teichoic acid export membrane protein
MIFFALFGVGPLSFVLPLILIAVYEAIALGVKSSYIPESLISLDLDKILPLLKESRWIIIGTIATSVATQGDYLVVGYIAGTDVLAAYFFGFQLVVAITALFDVSVTAVMMPALSKLKEDSERQGKAFVRSVRSLLVISSLLSVVALYVIPFLIEMLWKGKWNDSIIVVQSLVLTIPFWSIVSIAKSLLAARGLWKVRTVFLYYEAFSMFFAVLLGGLIGGLEEIVICVSMHRIIFTLALQTYVLGIFRHSRKEIFRILNQFLIPVYIIALTIYFIANILVPQDDKLIICIITLISFMLSVQLTWRVFVSDNIKEVLSIIKSGFNKNR